MSAALDLEDLEGAREELRDAIVQVLTLALITPSAKTELTETLFQLGSAHATVERAIAACGEPAKGANDA